MYHQRWSLIASSLALLAAAVLTLAGPGSATALEKATPLISSGAEMASLPSKPLLGQEQTAPASTSAPIPDIQSAVVGTRFEGFNFDDNLALTGYLWIPPDPMGAAGTDRVVAVANVMVEARTKAGGLLWRDSLRNFFAPAATRGAGVLGTFTFDPKVVYDQYEGRFVVVVLEATDRALGNPSDASRILIAVSKTSTPATATAADWNYWSINSAVTIGGIPHFADYPGLEVDEEVVYVTTNMFNFRSYSGSFQERLWIIHKGVVGGLYAGGSAVVTMHSPFDATSTAFVRGTAMPAQIFGAGGAGPGVGTYLVSYDALTYGGPGAQEALNIIRVNNPTGAVSFTQEFLNVGDLEDVGGIFSWPPLPRAPQLGSSVPIAVNDQRVLDVVWRNDRLWLVTTISPNAVQSAADVGQATVHWFKLNTSGVVNSGSPAGLIFVEQQGNISGEDITPGPEPVWTFFGSVAVNSAGDALFGFSAGASSIYCGSYMTGRRPGDPIATVRPSSVLHPGRDFYVRTFYQPPCFSTPVNRWGDFSGMSLDPTDDRIFWIDNGMAIERGTPTGGGCAVPGAEDGRWGTGWASCAYACVSVTCPGDLIVGNGFGNGSHFTQQYCFTNCGPLATTYDYTITGTQGWSGSTSGSVTLAPGATHCEVVAFVVPGTTPAGTVDLVTLQATPRGSPQEAASCTGRITVDATIPVAIDAFEAESSADGIVLSWRLGSDLNEGPIALRVQRSDREQGPFMDLAANLEAAERMTYLDRTVLPLQEYWYRVEVSTSDGVAFAGPIRATTREAQTRLYAISEPADGGLVEIRYGLASATKAAKLEIFDARGRRLRSLEAGANTAGMQVRTWDRTDESGNRVARGVYLVNLSAGGVQQSKKLVLAH